MVNCMFIRFVSGEMHENSLVSTGLFTAAFDVFIRTTKVERTGYVLYEDEAQVLAEPFADMRRLL